MSVFAQFLLWTPSAPKKDTHPTAQCPWVQVVGMDLQIYPQISRRRLGVTLFKTMRSLRSYIHQKLKFLVWKNILTQKAFFYSTYPKKSRDPSKVVLLWHLDFSRALCSSLALTWNWEERIFWSLLYAGPVGKAVQVSSPRYTPTHNSKREQGATKFWQRLVLATSKHIQWNVCLIIIMAWYTTSCLQSSMSGRNILMRVQSFSWVRISKRAQAKPNWLARSLKAW